MDKEIRAKGINLQEIDTLIKYLNKADNLSLEYKCLVISIARQTCINAKSKEDTKKAQELFKSKEKGNKTNHVANFVSNTWFWESMGHLQKLGALSGNNAKNNMHVVVVECGLQFMRDSYVIDSEKKMNVLKERQQIDWSKAVQKSTKLASAHSLTTMSAEAALTEKHFVSFKEGNTPSDSAAGNKNDSSISAGQSSSSVQDMARKKRTERLANLRRRVSATSLQNSTAAASVAKPLSAAKSPLPPSSHKVPDSISKPQPLHAPTNSRPPIPNAPTASWGISSSPIASSATSALRNDSPGPATPDPTANAPPQGSSWDGGRDDPASVNREESQPIRDSTIDSRHLDSQRSSSWGVPPRRDSAIDRRPSEIEHKPSWGAAVPRDSTSDSRPVERQPAWGNSRDTGSRPAEPQQRSSWNDANTSRGSGAVDSGYSRGPAQGYAQQPDMDGNNSRDPHISSSARSDRNQAISTSVVGDSGSAEARGRGWGSSSPHSTAYSAGSAHDNQTGGPGRDDQPRDYGGGNKDYSSNRDNLNKRPRDYDMGRNPRDQGMGQRRSRDEDIERMPNRNGDKRPRYDRGAPNRDPFPTSAGASGTGRGWGRTLPAWMTQDGPSASEGSQSTRETIDYRRDPPRSQQPQRNLPPQREAPVALQGNGRGLGRTLPAWMTSQADSGPQKQPSSGPPTRPSPPRENSLDVPPRVGGFSEPSTLQGTGRGKGRTLPAWMTQK